MARLIELIVAQGQTLKYLKRTKFWNMTFYCTDTPEKEHVPYQCNNFKLLVKAEWPCSTSEGNGSLGVLVRGVILMNFIS